MYALMRPWPGSVRVAWCVAYPVGRDGGGVGIRIGSHKFSQ